MLVLTCHSLGHRGVIGGRRLALGNTLEARIRLRTRVFVGQCCIDFTVEVDSSDDFEPPRHARYAATFFSKFWRVYRSGVFALRAEVAAESWSGGLGGGERDSTGATSQLTLTGSTFIDWHLEMQIVGVTLFWQMRNASAMRNGYVTGRPFPTIVQFYGARWTFRN